MINRSKALTITDWALRGTAAAILLQTLLFKFTGAKESVYIFTTVGNWTGIGAMEPWGRIGSGVAELAASILLLLPQTVILGSILSLGVISGAIFFHLTALGITLPAVDDQGELFALALAVFACSLAVLIIHRDQLPGLARIPALMPAAKR
jgi:uncharacterized protein involved in response to NO